MNQYDFVIIGGGIAGSAIVRELARYNVRIALIEAGCDVGIGATKGNGGMVHSGYDPKPGTLKAVLNVEGNRAYGRWAEELGFRFKRAGSLVVSFRDEDMPQLKKLQANAEANGVTETRIISREELFELEPVVNPEAVAAFYCPHTGQVDPFEVAVACVENAVANGAEVFLRSPVTAIEKTPGGFRLHTPDRHLTATHIINAAGLHADDVARMAGADEYTISARHGDIIMLDKNAGAKPWITVYPIPTPITKGVVVCTTISGNVLVGSTAHARAKDDTDSYKEGIEELLCGAKQLVPGLDTRRVIRPFAGERAVLDNYDNDFYIKPSATVENFFHVAGIQSPGVASAPGIARFVIEMLKDYGVKLEERTDFNPVRIAPPDFSEATEAERRALIAADPAYGQIVCRCETVTEAEIVEAIRANPPATTLDAVKRRTRAGMGRCQSGFCQSKVLHILARELGRPPEDILLEDPGSPVVYGPVKGAGKKPVDAVADQGGC